MPKEQILAIVRAWQSDPALLEQSMAKLQQARIDELLGLLAKQGVSAAKEDVLLAVDMIWILRQLTGNVTPSEPSGVDMRAELQRGLVGVVRQIDRGYARVMTMYTVAFYLGVGMVLGSIYAGLVAGSETSALVLGGLGMADILASMIFQPAQALQDSRGNLAQLQAAFFSWFNDVYNWNNYLQFIDRAATGNGQPPAFDKLREVSEAQMRNVEHIMKLVERYCEKHAPVSRKPSGDSSEVQQKVHTTE
jgi:hypothetical protein